MSDDRFSKPVTGRFFPLSATELAEIVEQHGFHSQYSGKRPAIRMENCTVECERGYQLCTFFRERYIAFFSFPELVPAPLARLGVEAALKKFVLIDKGSHLSVREQQFVVYRAYLGPVAKLIVTQHIISRGSRSYLYFDKVSQLSKSEASPKSEREIASDDFALHL